MSKQLSVAVLLSACAVFAQTPEPKPTFEVASIRPGSGKPITLPTGMSVLGAMQGGPGTKMPERFVGSNVTLRNLILRAYGLQVFQVSGPDWITTTMFDVMANVPEGTTKDQLNLMLQSLLEDRFVLKFHWDSKEFTVYNLVQSKKGVKLTNSVSTDGCSTGAISVKGKACTQTTGAKNGIAKTDQSQASASISPGPNARIFTAHGAPLTLVATMLRSMLNNAVVNDKTGLTGNYDVRFEFSGSITNTQDDSPAPDIFTALDQTLGLKLESAKEPMKAMVIDKIERQPTAN